MLEYLSISHYPERGDNVTSADNQQESLTVGWIIGFVDGEGCFSITLQRNATTKYGWQVFPEFVVTQGAKSLPALETLQQFFRCGKIFVNRRNDNHREPLYRFCVRSAKELREKIIPFFQRYPLRTAKQNDFAKFVQVVEMLERRVHLTAEGLRAIAAIAQTMNRQKPARLLESSETIRPTSRLSAGRRYSPSCMATCRPQQKR